MNIEDFVTYEQALKLKELGFDERCTHYYYSENLYEYSPKDYSMYCISWDFNHEEYSDRNGYNLFENCISAPTLTQVQKWLYKTFGLYIIISINNSEKWSFIIKRIASLNDDTFGWNLGRLSKKTHFKLPEEALSAGIDECIRLLNKNEKQEIIKEEKEYIV